MRLFNRSLCLTLLFVVGVTIGGMASELGVLEYILYSHTPTRRITIKLRKDSRNEMLTALGSYATNNGFTILMHATTQDGSGLIAQMTRSDCSIIADNSSDKDEYKVDIYASIITNVEGPPIDNIVEGLKNTLGQISGAEVTETHTSSKQH